MFVVGCSWPAGQLPTTHPALGFSISARALSGQDYTDTELLLSRENVDQEALLNYAREAADFSTQQQLPSLDFAINHYGQPDVAMFDFTCMYASENAALVREQNGHQLLVALVGDSLLEVSTERGRELRGRGPGNWEIVMSESRCSETPYKNCSIEEKGDGGPRVTGLFPSLSS